MARPEKVTVVDEIAEKIERTQSLYLTDFSGLDVEAINELRRLLRENSVEYRVVKNTLACLAAEKAQREELKPFLVGPTAIAFGYTDPVLPARLLSQFAQKTGKPEVKAVLFEGQLYHKDVMERLKFLPSREDLLAKMLGSLKSPMTQTVIALKGLLRNLVGLLEAIAKEKGPGAEASGEEEVLEKAQTRAEEDEEQQGAEENVGEGKEPPAAEKQAAVGEQPSEEAPAEAKSDGQEAAQQAKEDQPEEDSKDENT